jgi:hypothetical protein
VLGKRAWLVVGALLLATYAGAEAGYRWHTAPWSIDQAGRGTLTGPWAGTVRARQGAEYGLWLDLAYQDRVVGGRRRRVRGQSERTNLAGRATLCTPRGERYAYEAGGRADRDGRVTALWLEYGDPPLSALNLRLTGALQDRALRLTPDANPFLPDGTFLPNRTTSSADPDDSFAPATLTDRNPAAFEATCQRIRR